MSITELGKVFDILRIQFLGSGSVAEVSKLVTSVFTLEKISSSCSKYA